MFQFLYRVVDVAAPRRQDCKGITMSLRTIALSAATSTAIVATSLVAAPAAQAADDRVPGAAVRAPVATSITSDQLSTAIDEARAAGYVDSERVDRDGTRTTTIELNDGLSFDVVQPDGQTRLGAGSDGYGPYVSFNATDQSAIISGAGWALGAGVCAISAGTFCVVAGAIVAAATWAVTTNGIRCGSKSLRVYPFNGSRSPRCV